MALRRLLLAGLLLLPVTGGCSTGELPSLDGGYRENGVSVTVTVRPGAHGYLLAATFTPDRDGFHLYSADLPPAGVDGLGRPTVLAAGRGLQATGPVTADRAAGVLRPAGLDLEVPVYPDGPVTLTVPVEAAGGSPAEAIVGYAACSATTCLLPVSPRTVALHTIAS